MAGQKAAWAVLAGAAVNRAFAFSHNIVLCITPSESLMVSQNGALPSIEILTTSSSSGDYSYSTYFNDSYISFNFPQGVLFCFCHQKIKLVD